MQRYTSYRKYLREKFGGPVLKLPLNGGFSCPNRDGTKSSDGCAFCDNRSFSPAAQDQSPVLDQLASHTRHARGYERFLPYLQPFSNTYGSLDKLKSVYERLLTFPGVIGLAVGTRPDCLPDEILDYLGDLATRTYLSMELGIQSSHDATLARVNRGHTWSDSVNAINALSRRGIECVAHVMLGLPGETKEMMVETARRLTTLPLAGVKIHQLMIIEGTVFARELREGLITPLSIESYAELVSEFLAHLRSDMHIHRVMADCRMENGLIAPLWSADKTGSLRKLHSWMEEYDVVQGKRV